MGKQLRDTIGHPSISPAQIEKGLYNFSLSFSYSDQYFLTLLMLRVCVRCLLRCALSALDGEGETTLINVEGWIYRKAEADLTDKQRKVNYQLEQETWH